MMAIEKMNDFTFKHVNQPDNLTPAVLTPTQLKEKLDSQAVELRTFINNLVDILNSTEDGASGADNIAATPYDGLTGNTVQALIEQLKDALNGIVLGQVPNGSITDEKLSNDPSDLKSRIASLMPIRDSEGNGYWFGVEDGLIYIEEVEE